MSPPGSPVYACDWLQAHSGPILDKPLPKVDVHVYTENVLVSKIFF